MSGDREFPIHVFPARVGHAIYEVVQHTQAPLPMVAAEILGVISLACQNRIDVCRLNNLRGPTSLFIVTIAESGERKSTVSKLLMKPIYQLEEQLFELYKQEITKWQYNVRIFKAEEKALMSKLKSEIRGGKDPTITRRSLSMLQDSYPVEPVRYKLTFNDTTTAAIKEYLCGDWRSIGILSDEAGTIFNGYALNELPFVNKMWDGATYSVERKNAPERLIKNARLTLSLQVQPVVINRYIERKGDVAKGIGFFARTLINRPFSTQGYRQITNPVVSSEHLPLLHERLMEIVNESIANKDERICLHFSPDAGQKWIAFYNEVETEMQLIGFLSDFKDYASKVAENMARIAALLHYFNGDEGDIYLTAVDAAIEISSWYVNEYTKLFSKPQEVNMVNTDADELYWWIKEYCNRNFIPYMRKNTILQNGPDRFRKCSKANELLSILYSQGKINAYKKGKTLFIQPTSTLNVI
ncbi:YfjI family protein [Enterobacter huaxiensis]|uniref:YfjI family protein n=1 Tax=Enterobacter huaxiensis TaxID=2494702 RepID=UPI0021DB33F5|nr:YfjI family protein [Enterobacter huaxiensis]